MGVRTGTAPFSWGCMYECWSAYLRLDETGLLASLRGAGIAVVRDACPVFIDPRPPGASRAAPGTLSG